MNKIIRHILLFISLIITILIACNQQKKIIKAPIKEKGADYVFVQLKKNEFRFKCLNIKFNADIEYNGKKNSFGGTLRIKKDSLIWVSVTPALGIEAARILITPDSVKMLNRIEMTYFAGDIKNMNKMFKTNIDFDMLQSLLVGNDFSYYENDVFKASIDGNMYKLNTFGRGKLKKHLKSKEDSLKILMQDIWLDAENFKIAKVHIKELKGDRSLIAEYKDYSLIDSLRIPSKIKYEIKNEKDKIDVNIEYVKIAVICPLEFPFNVNSKYQNK